MLFVALGAYATVKVVGAAKRGVDRTIAQARRTVEDTTLQAPRPSPSRARPGELAQLRLKLRTSMRATQDALHAGVTEDESLKESLGLFERLSVHGHELDDELKRLETEPDQAHARRAACPTCASARSRSRTSADSLRWAARDRAHRFADDDLDSLSAQIDVEAGALRHWTTEPSPEPAGAVPVARGTGPGRGPAARSDLARDSASRVRPRSPTGPRITPAGPAARPTLGRRRPAPRARLDPAARPQVRGAGLPSTGPGR